MPPKMKVPDGEMNATELRKLIRAHNILVSIKIPKGTDRLGLIKLIEGKGYKVDHKKKAIIDSKADRPRRPQVTLKNAVELTKPKPVSEEEKKKRQQARQKKKGEKAFLKVAIPKAPPVSKKPTKVIKVGKPPPMKAKTPAPKAKTPAPKAKTPVKITKKVSLNDFLKNLTKISKAPEFIKIKDTMTDDEIIKRFNNTDDWKRFDVPIQKRLGKLLGFKL